MNTHDPVESRTNRGRVLGSLVAVFTVSGTILLVGWGSAASSPSAVSPTAQGRTLVRQYFTLLRHGDTAGLNRLLAPNFRAVRSNGDVQDKAAYLANPPRVSRFTLSQLKGSEYSGVLVVSYRITVIEHIAGHDQPVGPAPRLSVFQRYKGAWHLTAHANFGATVK